MKRHWIVATVLAFLAAALGFSALGDPASPTAAEVRVLPAGTYSAIVFTAAGVPTGNAALGVIKVGADQFPINIAPGTTTVLSFGLGWTLEREAEILLSKGGGTAGAVAMVWATTPQGPVVLRTR